VEEIERGQAGSVEKYRAPEDHEVVGEGEEKVSGWNGTVEEYQNSAERAEALLTRDQFFGILAVVW